MPERIYQVTEREDSGLEIRLDISEAELKRILRSLSNYHDSQIPQAMVNHLGETRIFSTNPDPYDDPDGVYFLTTQDKEGVRSIVRGQGNYYEETRKEVLRFEFMRGDKTPDYLDRFLESVGYKKKEKLAEEERKEAKTALEESLRPARHSRYQKKT